MLQEIVGRLPDREQIVDDLTDNPNLMTYGYKNIPLTAVTNLIRQSTKGNQEIKKMNDLELVFWLASLI